MTRYSSRRRFVAGLAAAGLLPTVAGCGGDGGSGGDGTDGGDESADGGASDGESDGGGGTGDDGGTDGGTEESGAVTAPAFDYTFQDGDAVVDGSFTGVTVAYPEGSGAVADASLGGLTLGGADVTGDLNGTATSNSASTYEISMGGSNDVVAGERLVVELSNVDPPAGSYEVTVTVNPQSGGTQFTESF